MDWLGLDVGGANLKVADGCGRASTLAFPLWQRPGELATALAQLIAAFPPFPLALTMTGELADCYATKAEGVRAIIEAAAKAAAGRPLRVYRVDGFWATAEQAQAAPLTVAAANWHALARLSGRWLDGARGVLIDVGSTTTDLVPITPSGPVAAGRTDPERLSCGELVYTGVGRSPVAALVRTVPWRGRPCPVAQEFFATTADAYLMLGDLDEDASRLGADGRPANRSFAAARLARSICADADMLSASEVRQIAQAVADAQLELVAAAASNQAAGATLAVISGSGEFLAARVARRIGLPAVSMAERLGTDVSRAAAAHAVAVLAREDQLQ